MYNLTSFLYLSIFLCCRYNEDEILCITDWGQKLSFFNKNGSEVINKINK